MWDVAVLSLSPSAVSYLDRAASDAGAMADVASCRTRWKYSTLSSMYIFQPTSVENHGMLSSSTLNFLTELGLGTFN